MTNVYELDIVEREIHERHLTWIVLAALGLAVYVVAAVLVTWIHAAA